MVIPIFSEQLAPTNPGAQLQTYDVKLLVGKHAPPLRHGFGLHVSNFKSQLTPVVPKKKINKYIIIN